MTFKGSDHYLNRTKVEKIKNIKNGRTEFRFLEGTFKGCEGHIPSKNIDYELLQLQFGVESSGPPNEKTMPFEEAIESDPIT